MRDDEIRLLNEQTSKKASGAPIGNERKKETTTTTTTRLPFSRSHTEKRETGTGRELHLASLFIDLIIDHWTTRPPVANVFFCLFAGFVRRSR